MKNTFLSKLQINNGFFITKLFFLINSFSPENITTKLKIFFHGFFYLGFSEIMQFFGFYAELNLVVPSPIYKLGFRRIQMLPLKIIGVTSVR